MRLRVAVQCSAVQFSLKFVHNVAVKAWQTLGGQRFDIGGRETHQPAPCDEQAKAAAFGKLVVAQTYRQI